ncbi:STAS domain-containing protein [Streptomyces sp. NPDC048182]|uniref:STAS domain-containing protein n=1 Tax=Streptomyces sp. NPDC048182 TaxID=3365507 RepID=UPI00371BE757
MTEEAMTDSADNGAPSPLSVVSTTTDGIRVLTVAGEIDYQSGVALQRALDAPGDAPARVVLDLHQVTFMDSSGINLFLRAYNALTAAGGWLRLAAPTDSVRRTLRLVGLDTVIDCHPDLEQALTR